MIHGLGVDIVHHPRIAKLFLRNAAGLVRRILTDPEQARYQVLAEDKKLPFLCTTWAIKEAAYKAAQPLPSSWKDAEVYHLKSGAPALRTSPNVPLDFKVSVSHDGEYTIASVLASNLPKSLMDKRGTGEMIDEHERDIPRKPDAADAWINKW
ncbi:4'-phosphopantetheinyl transferase superfamily [Protomyces lactucae-debilis]|uniref:4'-phosphopantetheinyl transferase superfamily n=1 Tax=Protomyces lactucae-debilis TaxID=2754530 RepID=A0A1Y2F1A9_PROLT|nr:4'-phosphopantetheinyl transferase superfamily [Protomyces lactucae-debilis]ORY77691.1 4'-phosphopantetheinyl transferase superfamily [Protomyces lactucae-debilis]